MKYRHVEKSDVELGRVLQYSVYNITGKLLLKKHKLITTERQKKFMLNHGVICNIDTIPCRQSTDKIKQYPYYKRCSPGSAFNKKNAWLSELYFLFLQNQHTKLPDFVHCILSIGLEIQLQVKTQHDPLLASLQLDLENHYGLIHALHVALSCEIIGKSIGLGQAERLVIVAAALTHDLGIIAEQETLNNQTEQLTEFQWDKIKQHPIKTEEILQQLDVDDSQWLEIVRHHHERLDGSGYPDGLAGAQISLGARIIAIADIYSAMVHPTAFRSEKSGKQVLTELYEMRGKELDSSLVECFIDEMGRYPPGSLVRLENNEIAVVYTAGSQAQSSEVYALLSPENDIYLQPILRNTQEDNHTIVKEEMLNEYEILLDTIETLWD